MNEFTASNGIRVDARPNGAVTLSGEPIAEIALAEVAVAHFHDTVHAPEVVALREFFQAEADGRLGRWRDPAQPEFLVYPVSGDGSRVQVVDETTGVSYGATRASAQGGDGSAAHYFNAHPEPKPWHDAKPWESWIFTIEGVEYAGTIDEDFEFRDPRDRGRNAWISVYDTAITAGRCLWSPEVSS